MVDIVPAHGPTINPTTDAVGNLDKRAAGKKRSVYFA
jgi:hypothetical protein